MISNYTGIVYLNDCIAIKEENGFIKVIATADIPSHTLLLVEHVYTGSSTDCCLIVRDNEYLYDTLHPRGITWKNEAEENKDAVALVKVVRNCFGKNLDSLFIGDFISTFNHCCIPNSVFFSACCKKYHDLIVNYIAVLSISNIKKGEELTIHYGFDRGHGVSDDFSCACEKSKQERDKICDVIYGIIVKLQKDHLEKITAMVYDYEIKSKHILVYQYLAKKGLISTNSSVVSMTKSFVKYLNSVYHEGTIDDKKEKMIDHVNDLFSYLD